MLPKAVVAAEEVVVVCEGWCCIGCHIRAFGTRRASALSLVLLSSLEELQEVLS